jgi:hypothetical protein
MRPPSTARLRAAPEEPEKVLSHEAHLRKSDGTELEVLVNKDFKVTAVDTMRHP